MPDRPELPCLEGCAYLNAGTNGPMPRAGLDAMADEVRASAGPRIGKAAMERLLGLRARARAAAARALGADADEVALTSSTTQGIGLVCAGLDWSAGGEIVTTTEEHPGLEGPLDELAQRHGMVIRAVPSQDVVATVGPATRMVALSHVLWTTGLVLPLAEIAAAAHAVGATLLVDGAQSGGAIPLDMRASGADFYAASGQKWLLGPQGTGVLWVHPDRYDMLRPAMPSYFTYADGHVGPFRAGGARYDSGSIDTTVLAAFAAGMEWVEGQPGGRAAWSALGAANAAEARRRLAGVPGVAVHDPGGPCTGLIALRLDGHESADAVAHLAERNVLVRPIPGTPFVRVSVGAWTDASDIDALIAGLATLTG
ncbi:MAG TPA: aminotransferase class V-fold PLP-dependent enzyme [Gaiellales bacterium]